MGKSGEQVELRTNTDTLTCSGRFSRFGLCAHLNYPFTQCKPVAAHSVMSFGSLVYCKDMCDSEALIFGGGCKPRKPLFLAEPF